MKIVLFGSTGNIGSVILDRALARGHEVLAVVRTPAKLSRTHERLQVLQGDILRPETYADAIHGADAAIASTNDGDPDAVPRQAGLLLSTLAGAGIRRFAWVGGAGSLEVAPGVRVIDTPDFPEAWKAPAMGMVKALDVFRASTADIDWTFVSPPALIVPGERKGHYRLGGDQLLVDADGHSTINYPDYADAVLDRVEKGDAARRRVTVAY